MSSNHLSEIKVPALGESIREATVSRWLKSVGDLVKVDEILVELETDKVSLEVTAPASGILKEIRFPQGSAVSVGDLLGFIAPEIVFEKEQPLVQKKLIASERVAHSSTFSQAYAGLSPSVRKMTEELKINPREISATGKGGRITKEDVINFAEAKSSTAGTSSKPARLSDRREERVKMTRLRQRIAERLKQAQNTAAILTTFNEVDMTAINTLRSKYKDAFEKKHGVRLGIMSFFVKACIQALKEIPAVNAEIDRDDIIYKNYYDIGVAISAPQGLVVPIIRDADILSFDEIEKEIAALGEKARNGKLSIEEMTGGTFTVSNGGIFGSLMSTPILNPPQTGILGMHKIQERPVVIDGRVEVRPMMYIALSYDHRVIDGRESVTFLVRVKENLENPERLLLGM